MNYLLNDREKIFDELGIKSNYTYDKECHYTEYLNAVVLPEKKGLGGVCGENGDFIDASKYVGDWVKKGGEYNYDKDIKFVERRVIYLGFFIRHWGHFLLDCIGRMWISNVLDVHDYYWVYLEEDNRLIEGNYREFLEYLGFDMNKRIEVDEVTRFSSVIIPEVCRNNKYQHTKEYGEIFNRVVANSGFDEISVPEKVYLSRLGYPDAIKKERGEDTIQNSFVMNGYIVLYPESLSLKHQIALFQKADEIACINGTIPLNYVFSDTQLHLIVLNKTSLLHKNMHEISSIGKGIITYIDAYIEPIRNHPRYLGEGPFLICLTDNLKKYFVDNNMTYNEKNNLFNYCWYYRTYLFRCLKKCYGRFKRMIKNSGGGYDPKEYVKKDG